MGGSLDTPAPELVATLVAELGDLPCSPRWLTCTGRLLLRPAVFLPSPDRLCGSTGQSFQPSIEDGANWYDEELFWGGMCCVCGASGLPLPLLLPFRLHTSLVPRVS